MSSSLPSQAIYNYCFALPYACALRTLTQKSVQNYNKFFKYANILSKKLNMLAFFYYFVQNIAVCTKVRTLFRRQQWSIRRQTKPRLPLHLPYPRPHNLQIPLLHRLRQERATYCLLPLRQHLHEPLPHVLLHLHRHTTPRHCRTPL